MLRKPTAVKTDEPDVLKKKLGLYGPVTAIAVTLLAYFGSQLFGGFVIGLIATVFGYSGDQIAGFLEKSAVWQFSFILVVDIAVLIILWWFMSSRGISLKTIGLGRKPRRKDVSYALLTFGIYFTILIGVVALVSAIIPGIDLQQEQQLSFEYAQDGLSLVLVFIGLVILPSLVEEILVRGFLYTGLRKAMPYLQASISASLLFGAAHLQLGSGAPPLWVAAIDTFVLSVVLIELRERTGALWSGIMVHGLKNSLAFLSLFVFASL